MPVLTPAHHDDFLRLGYVVVRGLVPAEVVAAAVEVLDQEPEDRLGAMWSVQAPELFACVESGVDQAAAELFGDVAHVRSELMYKGRRVVDDQPWSLGVCHVDSNYPTIMPDTWCVGAFIFLTPVGRHGGAFCVKPGSPMAYRARMIDGYPHFLMDEWGNEHGLVELEAAAGDVVLFQFNLGHSASANTEGPTVRMALDARYATTAPVVPGHGSVESLSSVEKAASTRLVVPSRSASVAAPITAADEEASVEAHEVIRFGGRTWRYFVRAATPDVVFRQSTLDFSRWTHAEPVPVGGGAAVRSLSFFAHRPGVFLSVARGEVGTTVYCTRDLETWEEVAVLPDVTGGSVFWTSEYSGGESVMGATIFAPDGDARVVWRIGPEWSQLSAPGKTGVAAEIACGNVVDVAVRPVVSDRSYALVVDVVAGEERRTHCTLSSNVGRFEDPLLPIEFDRYPPRQLRVYDRSFRWWLVSYLAQEGQAVRPRWGVIDWSRPRPHLRDLETPAALGEALAVVGLR